MWGAPGRLFPRRVARNTRARTALSEIVLSRRGDGAERGCMVLSQTLAKDM